MWVGRTWLVQPRQASLNKSRLSRPSRSFLVAHPQGLCTFVNGLLSLPVPLLFLTILDNIPPTPNTMRATSLAAFTALSFALPYLALANDHSGHARRHHDIAARQQSPTKRDPEVLSKRYDNMRFTFYDVGL